MRADGALLAHVRGPLSSPHHLGLEAVGRRCSSSCSTRRSAPPARTAGRRRAVAQVFLAGVDFPAEEELLRAALDATRFAGHVVVGNDTLALLRAGTERGWGVAVVCGAGINCVGVGARRAAASGSRRSAAITGDWGGGYDVGSEALFVAARSEDGRGPRTSLEQAVPRHFGLDSPRRLAEEMHARRISHRRLIELAPVVFAEAAQRRGRGRDRRAARRRGRRARARRAHPPRSRAGSRVEVVLGGGLLRAGDERLQAAIVAGLAEVGDGIAVHTDRRPARGRRRAPRPRLARSRRRREGAGTARAHRRRRCGRRPRADAARRHGGAAWLTSGTSARRASTRAPTSRRSTRSTSTSPTAS